MECQICGDVCEELICNECEEEIRFNEFENKYEYETQNDLIHWNLM